MKPHSQKLNLLSRMGGHGQGSGSKRLRPRPWRARTKDVKGAGYCKARGLLSQRRASDLEELRTYCCGEGIKDIKSHSIPPGWGESAKLLRGE